MAQFRGLVHKTAILIVGSVEDDFDDIVQILWIKCWRASLAYDPIRSRMSLQRFVFMAMRNQVKDLQKRRRRGELSLEGLTEQEDSSRFGSRDSFDAKYLAADVDQVYGEVEAEPLMLPNTIGRREREIVVLLMEGYSQAEVRLAFAIDKREMEKLMRSIRTKLADWKPSRGADVIELPVRATLGLAA